MMWRERALLVIVLFQIHQICGSKNQKEHICPPSSCGKIRNILYPFRLKGSPEGCGDHRYQLSCENNATLLFLFSGKYEVQTINYNNFTIRVADPGLQHPNCSFLPRYFLSPSNFTDIYYYSSTTDNYPPYQGYNSSGSLLFEHIVFLNCDHPVSDNSKYVDIGGCVNWEWKGYNYAIAGDLFAEDLEVGCEVKLVAPTSWWGLDANQHYYATIHAALLYGFELSWILLACENHCGSNYQYCYFDSHSQEFDCQRSCDSPLQYYYKPGCDGNDNNNGTWWKLLSLAEEIFYAVGTGLLQTIDGPKSNLDGYTPSESRLITFGHYVLPYMAGRFFFGLTLGIALLIYKWRKRHLSIYENIENYLEENNLMPIRYSYSEIKNMAKGFKDKLGEGGYGSVFKGKLRSGSSVAIKMLNKSKGNGQDFISEVATIGRIHHQNVVQLIGYCVHGSKRILVYELMANGSLDKFIFSKDGSPHLTDDIIYNIAIGVASGIAYLHHGCEMKILHFDIKPHNILLDEKFTPKISDFGLAKLYPVDNSIVTMTAARGTIGYMAPELFYKNIGGISHKADVYSFGMLLMEMASNRKNLNPQADRSSQLYFPFWIYDQLKKEKDIEIEDVKEEEEKVTKKMIIVALWCIQLKPHDRPSMNKVVEMLEEDVKNLKIPPKPSLYPHETIQENEKIYTSQTISTNSISSSNYSVEIVNNTIVDENI